MSEQRMITKEDMMGWVDRLHAIAEKYHIAGIRPKDQCALHWSANIVAEKIKEKNDE